MIEIPLATLRNAIASVIRRAAAHILYLRPQTHQPQKSPAPAPDAEDIDALLASLFSPTPAPAPNPEASAEPPVPRPAESLSASTITAPPPRPLCQFPGEVGFAWMRTHNWRAGNHGLVCRDCSMRWPVPTHVAPTHEVDA
jgi:hypothetical protein